MRRNESGCALQQKQGRSSLSTWHPILVVFPNKTGLRQGANYLPKFCLCSDIFNWEILESRKYSLQNIWKQLKRIGCCHPRLRGCPWGRDSLLLLFLFLFLSCCMARPWTSGLRHLLEDILAAGGCMEVLLQPLESARQSATGLLSVCNCVSKTFCYKRK